MARHLSLSVLGTFYVQLDREPVTEFGYDKVRALLAYLAMEAGTPQRRDALTALFWPEQADIVARKSLNQALYTLRKALGGVRADTPFLLVDRTAIQLNPAAHIRLDTQTFQTHVAATANHQHDNPATCAACAAEWRQAASLFRGEFLQGLSISGSPAFDEWLALTREQLHRPAMQVLAALTQYHTWRGEWEEALGFARRWASLEPWQEEAQQRVMRLLAKTGEYNAAIAQYENCRAVLQAELGLEPTPETSALFERIRRARQRTARHNLPPQPTGFIGRKRELARLRRLLAHPERRLITLVGPGGIGKTRLAIETAREQAAAFLEGVTYVPLAEVESAEALVSAVATALQMQLQAREPPFTQVINYLRRKEMLLVLDNFEQLVGNMDLLLGLFAEAPTVKLLVTSRRRLNLHGEWVVDLAGLDYPPPGEEEALKVYSAVRLFARSAGRVQSDFSLPANQGEVARICRLVEGMPLALEMSAAWVNMLSPAKIAAEIERGLDLLAIEAPNLPPRHRSMRAVYDSSWQRLDPAVQQVLVQLSIFHDGFTVEAAAAVAGASQRTLASLVARSLLQQDQESNRYQMHELLRQYSAEKLGRDAALEMAVRVRHTTYYLSWIKPPAREDEWLVPYDTQQEGDTVSRLDRERQNLFWAIKFGLALPETRPVAVMAALGAFRLAYARGYWREWLPVFEEAIAACGEGETLLKARLLGRYGQLLRISGHLNAAIAAHEAELALAIKTNNPLAVGKAQCSLGQAYKETRQFEQALDYCHAALEELEHAGEKGLPVIGNVLNTLGRIARQQGNQTLALDYLSRAVGIKRQGGDKRELAWVLHDLGRAYRADRQYDRALDCFEEAKELLAGTEYIVEHIRIQADIGRLFFAKNDMVRAELVFRSLDLPYLRQTNNLDDEANILTSLGNAVLYQQRYPEAATLLRKAVGLWQQLEDKLELANAVGSLGEALAGEGDHDQAEQHFQKALSLLKDFIELPRARRLTALFTAELGKLVIQDSKEPAAKAAGRLF